MVRRVLGLSRFSTLICRDGPFPNRPAIFAEVVRPITSSSEQESQWGGIHATFFRKWHLYQTIPGPHRLLIKHQTPSFPLHLCLGGHLELVLLGISRAGPGEENGMYQISDFHMRAGHVKDFRWRGRQLHKWGLHLILSSPQAILGCRCPPSLWEAGEE